MFTDTHNTSNTQNFTHCLSGKQVLLDPKYRDTWRDFRAHIPLIDADFEQYYTATLLAFAEHVQNLPATRHIFYAAPGGFFQLGLDRAIIATKLALQAYQEFDGRAPHELTAYDVAELFAVFSAALLSDLGLLIHRFHITLNNHSMRAEVHDPYRGSMLAQGDAFSFQFRMQELMDWGAPSSLVLAERLLSRTHAHYDDTPFAWMSSHKDHSILQLWYHMMLELTPPQDSSSRYRRFLSLIPLTDDELIHDFLLNISHDALIGPNKQKHSLFVPNAQEPPQEASCSPHKAYSNTEASGGTANQIFGPIDAANVASTGSRAAETAPLLAYGIGFLQWLAMQVRHGRLSAGGDLKAYAWGDAQVVLDIKQIQAVFEKEEKKFGKASAQELMISLENSQLFRARSASLRTMMIGNDPNGKFSALVLPRSVLSRTNQIIGFPVNLVEVKQNVAPEKNKSSGLFTARSITNHRLLL